jgi:protocatechuate 4,5-dioxygenase alpha chain
MVLEHFDARSQLNNLVQDLKWNRELRERFGSNEAEVLDSYTLSDAERRAVGERDFRCALELGLHPYLLSQLARLIYGNSEAEGASQAATALIRSLLGDQYERYVADRGL